MGGRGAYAGLIDNSGRHKHAPSHPLFPAELNYDEAEGNTIEDVLGRFRDKYKNAKVEYAASVDDDGYAYQHVKGGRHSVGITPMKGQTIIHNHPSGSNFSFQDLETFSFSDIKGIMATSSSKELNAGKTFHIQKTDKFNGTDFVSALTKTRIERSKSPAQYDSRMSRWLKANQSKYGYTYRELKD